MSVADLRPSVVDLSDRPMLCLAVNGQAGRAARACVGSTDHGLWVVDVGQARKDRELYTKTAGHAEWVTACAYMDDGRIASGGMDNKICVWGASGRACTDLLGHRSSVSAVLVLPARDRLLSAAYDHRVILWHVRRRGVLAESAGEHKGAVVGLALAGDGSRAMSVGRRGEAVVWDLGAGDELTALAVHGRADPAGFTSVCGTDDGRFVAGGMSGTLHIWSADDGALLARAEGVHDGPINAVRFCETVQLFCTAGADGRLLLVDEAARVMSELTRHEDCIYSLHEDRGILCSGDGHGFIHVHDCGTDALLGTLDAGKNAIRALATTDDALVAMGDDGDLVIFATFWAEVGLP